MLEPRGAATVVEVVPHGLHHVSGVVSSVVELSAALASRGRGVVVISPGSDRALNPPARDALAGAGVVVEVAGGRTRIECAHNLVRRLRSLGPVVVHLHNGFSPFNNLVGFALARSGVPYLVTTHGVYAPEGMIRSRRKKQVAARLLDRPLLERAAAVTALTGVEVDEIEAIAPGAHIVNVPLGFDAPPPTDRSAFRAELAVPDPSRLAVYCGRFDIDHKRLDALVEAVAATPHWHLALVGGDGRTPAELRAVIDSCRVADRVHVVGPRYGEDLAPVLAGADLAVLISKSEGLPRGLIQSMAYGVPALISSEVSRRLETVRVEADSDDGVPWRIVDPPNIAEALAELAEEPIELADLGRSARRWAEGLEWGQAAPRWLDLIERVSGAA